MIDRLKVIVDGVDVLAKEYEEKWGVGRLRLIVDDDLRERFDEQCVLFNEALFKGDLAMTREHGHAMKRAYAVLDEAATEAGKKPLSPVVWEVRRDDGKVIAIVRNNEDAHAVCADGRYVETWTTKEFARLLNGSWHKIGKAKEVFPGAEVLNYTDAKLPDDEIPF